MTSARDIHISSFHILPQMPPWVTSGRGETPEEVAFLSGGALSALHLAVGDRQTPRALLRARLALRAAEACVAFSGRPERAGDLRDAVHLMRAGDLPGPAGAVTLSWMRAVERPLGVKTMQRALRDHPASDIARWLNAGQEGPVARSARVLEGVLPDAPRAEATALILADAALAQALGWTQVVPLLAVGFKRSDLRKRGDDLTLACHRAVVAAATEAVQLATDLARRVAHLNAVAPKLRAKGAGAAVEMFLTCDAVAPSALPLPDRAARRLCDRLVDLGAVRELTGRDTFRLYGV